LCLRHADRVLALTSGGPVPNWVFWHPQLRFCDLVFVDRGDGVGVSEWTKALVPKRRFRVADGTGWRAGVEAAARRLAGRSTGVVLSGGGARGFAHIGALEELLAAGVTIDRVGGVSCGAWIGAMFALGMDADEIDARCYEDWVRRNPLTDYTFPRTAMIRGHRVRAVFERNLPGLIEELPRDYFCVSCDLVEGELIVHRDGALDVAAAASQCLPGLAPPVALDGRLLIDGGVLNNLPVDVMAATREGPVIAVDVTTRYRPPTSDGQRRRRGPTVNGLWDNHTPRPSVLETISRALALGSVDTEQAAREHADIVIQPVEPDVGMLEWHQLDRVRERGRRAAREVLASTEVTLSGR
jgi:predicted acylesterase/phospholipase RssA